MESFPYGLNKGLSGHPIEENFRGDRFRPKADTQNNVNRNDR